MVSESFISIEGAPIRLGLIYKEVGLLGRKGPCRDILEVTYTLTVGTNIQTTAMISLLHILEQLLESGTIYITVSQEDLKSHCKRGV